MEEDDINDLERDYTPDEEALMKKHNLEESQFEAIYGDIYRHAKEYGTEAVGAVLKYVSNELLNE